MIEDEFAARRWLGSLSEWGETARERLETLLVLLGEENARQNLVSAASLGDAWVRHVIDSAQLLRFVPRGTPNWLDLGTGAGFPGLVVAILRPDCPVTMVESRARRIEWLNRIVERLALPAARVEGRRLELVETAKYGVISARAFAPLDKLITLSARFSTSDTIWVLPKGDLRRKNWPN